MSSAVNLLANSPKISDLTKRDIFRINLYQNDKTKRQNSFCEDFRSVLEPFPRCLWMGVLKQYLLDI